MRARIRFRAAYPTLSQALEFAGSFTSSVILLLWLQPKLDPTPSATAPEPLGVFLKIAWPNGTISTYWLKDKDSVYETMPAIMAEVVINGWSINIDPFSEHHDWNNDRDLFMIGEVGLNLSAPIK